MLRGGFLHFLAKTSPFFVQLFSLLYAIIEDNKRAYLFFGGALGSDVLNVLLKKLVYPLCRSGFYPKELLGTCDRPNPNVKCSSFKLPHFLDSIIEGDGTGMPSGHAQFAAFTAVYWLRYLNYYMKHDPKTLWLSLGLVIYAFFVPYSRVALSDCHTVQQVIVGGLIGALIGWIFYEFSEWWLKRPVPLKIDKTVRFKDKVDAEAV